MSSSRGSPQPAQTSTGQQQGADPAVQQDASKAQVRTAGCQQQSTREGTSDDGAQRDSSKAEVSTADCQQQSAQQGASDDAQQGARDDAQPDAGRAEVGTAGCQQDMSSSAQSKASEPRSRMTENCPQCTRQSARGSQRPRRRLTAQGVHLPKQTEK